LGFSAEFTEDSGDVEREGNCVTFTCSSGSDLSQVEGTGRINTIPCNTKEISNMGRHTICTGVGKFFSNSGDFMEARLKAANV
jgi:hypothetical protein